MDHCVLVIRKEREEKWYTIHERESEREREREGEEENIIRKKERKKETDCAILHTLIVCFNGFEERKEGKKKS